MPFTPASPHLTVALSLGNFGQFSDPLDWVAQRFGLDVKVDRTELMENLAMRRAPSAGQAVTEALGNDRRTRFRIQLFGRCEGQLVAMCGMTFHPSRFSLKELEERSVDLVVLNLHTVLGVQATYGVQDHSLEGLKCDDPMMRLMPLNVFNRAFFQEKIEAIEKDRKLKIADLGDACMIQLVKRWQYYDVPRNNRTRKMQKLLPF